MFDHVLIYPLTILFVFVVVLLLIGTIYSRVHWIAKAMLTLLSLTMFALFYQTYVDAMGWPVAVPLPTEEFKFIAAEVHEPDIIKNDAGNILLWFRPVGEDDPRAIKIPYSRNLHKAIEKARQKAGKGMPVYLKSKKKAKDSDIHADSHYDGDTEDDLDFVPPPFSGVPKENSSE